MNATRSHHQNKHILVEGADNGKPAHPKVKTIAKNSIMRPNIDLNLHTLQAMKESGIKKDGKQLASVKLSLPTQSVVLTYLVCEQQECSVEEYGKLLKARGEKSLMTVWKEMGYCVLLC